MAVNFEVQHYRLVINLLAGAAASILLTAAAAPAPSKATPASPTSTAPTKPSKAQSLTGFEQESLAIERAANRAAERANRIADAQRIYGLWQLALGALGVAFTGVAAFFAWRAAHHTKRSADEAVKAASAAAEANAITRSTTRPWVQMTFDVIDVEDWTEEGRTTAALRVKLNTKNIGNLPAFGVKVWALDPHGTEPLIEQIKRWIVDPPAHPEAGITLFPGEGNIQPGTNIVVHPRATSGRAFTGDFWLGGIVAYFLDRERTRPAYTPFIHIISFDEPDAIGRFTRWYSTPHFYQVEAT